ncbi:MarC family protein [Ligilactobacillus equi]|uniref:UPF0056 membrane protein n=1 Tax=Ligilactobacillus equi DPC 6820 TaxID=1392007 RepID=V7HTJ3_9LACO|nr:MarC family protein [Ligilactobacillus equi]ETA73534.1 hypothetical protein LEQ_1479c [Ligilactobacillus equi DPC 6820]
MKDLASIPVVLMAFFAILNPIGNLPVFISLTASDEDKVSHAVARKALTIATIIVILFTFGGKEIFTLFGIDLAALRSIGGIIIAIIGYDMLKGKSSSLQHNVDPKHPNLEQEMSVAITPLAMPILAGPGTIATAMNLANRYNPLIVVFSFILLALLTYFLFVYGEIIVKKLGENMLAVITRLMGLILAVIGTDMLFAGLKAAFKILN